MPHIIACTDGSVYAPSVYDHAAWAARRIGASLEILHVLDRRRQDAVLTDLSGNIGIGAQEELLEHLAEADEAEAKVAQTRARAVMDDARARLSEQGIDDARFTSRHGTLIGVLEEEEERANLIVIGKRGEAADFDKLHLGANLERVIRGSRHPVLVTARAFRPINRILIAYDGSASARKAINHACTGNLLKGLDCHLLMVGEDNAKNRAALEDAAAQLTQSGQTVVPVLKAGETESIIADYVKSEGIDLLVVGAYGHSRIRQLVIGSTTTTLIRTCQIPLLMFR